MYGLKFNKHEWDSLVHNKEYWSSYKPPSSQQNSLIAASTTGAVKSAARSMAWSAVKVLAPAARMLSRHSRHPAMSIAGMVLGHSTTVLDEFSDPVVIPSDGIETVLYLDDSGSMDGNLYQGKAALDSMAPLIQGSSIRTVKFGRGKTIVSPREKEWSTALTFLNWDASSGSTYMWKMIEDDVLQRYRPSPSGANPGKLRLILITDGFDTDSPGEYRGIKGMDPMMKTLLAKGYNIEFHIVVLGNHSRGNQIALKRYQSLAEATGGGYMALSGLFYNEKSADVINFMSSLDASNDTTGSASLRRRQRQDYLEAAKEGKREKFDWLHSLPSQ